MSLFVTRVGKHPRETVAPPETRRQNSKGLSERGPRPVSRTLHYRRGAYSANTKPPWSFFSFVMPRVLLPFLPLGRQQRRLQCLDRHHPGGLAAVDSAGTSGKEKGYYCSSSSSSGPWERSPKGLCSLCRGGRGTTREAKNRLRKRSQRREALMAYGRGRRKNGVDRNGEKTKRRSIAPWRRGEKARVP